MFDQKKTQKIIGAICVSGCLLGVAQAREPFTPEELKKQQEARYKVAEEGYNLWHGSKPSMSTNGLACGNCHPDAAASNPQTFPKYIPAFNRVASFAEMVNWCIKNPQGGKEVDIGGPEMNAMATYAFELHRGRIIQPGLATQQTAPVVVEYGKGFPSKPSMIGKDTKW